jgi:DNA-binding SARP family transcriptional activator
MPSASFSDLVLPSYTVIQDNFADHKLLLIHPNSRYRTLLIASLINEPPCPLFYYGLGTEDTSLAQLLAGLTHDLAVQYPTFGRRINKVRHESPDDLAAQAEALAADLDELSEDDYILILDEYDRVDAADEAQIFFAAILDVLPPQCHLLINARTLPRLPWVALVARHEAVVLRDARLLSSGFYSEQDPDKANLEAYALGPGYILRDGQPVNEWEGHLPRLLFFFTLDRPMVTRAEICEAFWPDLPLDQAVNVFHVTKRRLHKAIQFDVLTHESGHYRIDPSLSLQYDVLGFVDALVEARNSEGEAAAEAWQRAIDLYRGAYLQGHDQEWILNRRADFSNSYVEALTGLARLNAESGEDEQALGLLLRAVSEAPRREDLHRDVMQLYAKLGRRSEGVEHYLKLESELKETLGVEPSPETRAVYKDISG